jgi:phosphatidylinositol 4-phosphatase
VNQRGSEGRLERKFRDLVQACRAEDALSYEGFDFHKECKKSWKNLEKLMHTAENTLNKMGYFHADYIRSSSGKKFIVSKKQVGVFRTNCIDCLDRTNVVQSMFAKRVAEIQLFNLGLVDSAARLESNVKFDLTFRNLWADNADMMSVLYSGTGALKTDYTRTGKRTKAGALKDVRNSAKRYYLNNFRDGERQDAIDLVTGKFVPQSQQFPQSKQKSFLSLFRICLIISFILLYAYSILSSSQVSNISLFLKSLLASLVLSYTIALQKGREYVNRPSFISRSP